jgi:hypothetical protein
MLVLSAVKPFWTTSRPSAATSAQVAHRRRSDEFVRADAACAAVRPVETDIVTGRAPEKLGYGYPEGPCFNVDQGQFDAGDGFGCCPVRALAAPSGHIPESHFKRARVLADEYGFEVFDGALDAEGHLVVAAFAPSGDTVVGFHLDE